jgi:HD-GYP domain-containing protein (c-di-GMP phosphodiesterase class II)
MPERRPAGARDGDDEVAFDRALGAQLLTRLHGLLRTSRLYDLTNQTLRDQLDDMLRLLGRATEGELVLVAMGQCFYLNGTRLRAEPSQAAMFEALSREFDVRRVGGLRFLDGLAAEELGVFIRIMGTHAEGERAHGFAQAVADAGVLRVVPVSLNELGALARDLEEGAAEDDTSERGRARQSYQRAVRGARSAILRTARTGKPPIRRVKRLVQPVVDSIMKNEYSIVGLTALRNHDEYTYAHCVNVSVLSIAMGQRLGLSRTELADLGVAGLLHDVGKLTIPAEVLGKPGRLTSEERELMQRHPLEGLKVVARMPGLSALTVVAMEVCLLHHRHWRGGGYPEIAHPRARGTHANIVAVADCFDAMTAHRAYRARPFTGYESLRQLLGREREHFDPAALWALVRTIGLYPAGTVMLTLSGHMVLSVSPDPAAPARPFCRVLSRPDGSMPAEHEAEVWQPMPAHETVARVVAPEEFDFEVDQLLAA